MDFAFALRFISRKDAKIKRKDAKRLLYDQSAPIALVASFLS